MANPAQIQYAGLAGISRACEDAVLRFLQYGDTLTAARILTCDGFHAFLLTIDEGDLVAIKAGFSSGYSGEGPKTLSRTLVTLHKWGIPVDEVDVSAPLLERLERSALTERDVQSILESTPRRAHWYTYVFDEDFESECPQQAFRAVLPFALIDSRILDIALRFADDPDQCLLTAYRRLEAVVRSRAHLTAHGSALFSKAFLGEKAVLGWPTLEKGEQGARAQMFCAAYSAYRNPRAHHPPEVQHERASSYPHAHDEFLVLNHLFRLESQAVELEPGD